MNSDFLSVSTSQKTKARQFKKSKGKNNLQTLTKIFLKNRNEKNTFFKQIKAKKTANRHYLTRNKKRMFFRLKENNTRQKSESIQRNKE